MEQPSVVVSTTITVPPRTYRRQIGLMKVNRRALGHNDEMAVLRPMTVAGTRMA
jgi:hypothetical protein